MKNENYKEIIINGLTLVLGIFIYAMCFNLFLTPNNLVVSGFSGLAIVFHKIFNINANVFIYVANILVLFIGFFLLDLNKTKRNILGSILYPFMITVTMPISNYLMKYLVFDDFLIQILLATILFGVGSGLIYRSGFTTGGTDIIMQIINKYMKISESKSMLYTNAFIILMGIIVFGLNKGIYSFIILIGSTYFVDKIMFGIETSKLFYITTKKRKEVMKIIMQDFNTGLTCVPSKGGFNLIQDYMIMCVVANNDYYLLKQRILEIDPNAFIVIDTCYEVNNGVKRRNLPFI